VAVLFVKKLRRVIPVIREYGRVYFYRRKQVSPLEDFSMEAEQYWVSHTTNHLLP
jgi:hypothetical protein